MKLSHILIFLLLSIFWTFNFSNAQTPPLVFVPNEGQWEEPFLYKGIAPFADIYLEKDGITYLVGAADNFEKIHQIKESSIAPASPVSLYYHAYKMQWLGANTKAIAQPSKKQNYYHNYYLGNKPENWKSGVSIYGNVDYIDIYPKIDLHLGSEKGGLKYDFIVKPGGNPQDIRFRFDGAENTKIQKGQLIIQTSVGEITEMAPYAFQYINGELHEVPCQYMMTAQGEIYFHFPKGYDKNTHLTIDPTVVFASLTGSTADNWGFTATYDKQGNLYAGGITNGNGYPTSLGAFQLSFGGGSASIMPCDITISKFTSDGSNLMYSTYLGGSADEMPHSLIVDTSNNLIVAGKSESLNFPTKTGAYSVSNSGGYDFIISKFNSSGTDLLASTYVGGAGDDGVNISSSFYGVQTTLSYNYGDAFRTEVIIDNQNNVYLVGSSQSGNFPVSSNALKSTLGGTQDGIFLKMNPSLSNLLYSTYIGGNQDDAAYVLALDTAQNYVYVSGGTASSDFHPTLMSNGYQPSYQGGTADGYILKFQNSGNYPVVAGTFIGTSAYDQCYGIQVDLENNVYAMGQTLGNFPVSTGVYSNPGSPQFIIKLSPNLNNSIYSTVFGSGPSTHPNISPVAFLVDTCQNVYISGWAASFSTGSSTLNLPITPDAFQSTTDGSDFYFIVLSKNAINLLFASYFGSPGKPEHVDGGTSRFDPDGVVYQAICASCGNGSAYPATPGAYSGVKGSNNCNLGVVKIAFNLGSVKAVADVTPNATGCAPLHVQFSNNSSNAVEYYWNFGDGSPTSNLATPSHTFTNPGVYNITFVAINPNACKTRDTVHLTVTVTTDTIQAKFNLQLHDTCQQPYITLQNTSQPLAGQPLSSATYYWDFGDGQQFTGAQPPNHYYQNPGNYSVRLVMIDTNACNSPDTFIQQVNIEQIYVNAGFNPPPTACEKTSIDFTNTSQNASDYFWDFGDGNTSTATNPSHTYQQAGTYTVRLRASNPQTCNQVDSIVHSLNIATTPLAAFKVTPINPEVNTPYDFHNESQGATSYHWDFGDGQQSDEMNPSHAYGKSGEYNVCLTVTNAYGCQDKTCKRLRAEVHSLVDVPTGFSPNGDGTNDILYVRGYNIATMVFKIYNRWGNLVFESTDINHGWDGTYKGQPQEMEVYGYVLDVVFTDGSTAKKKGNITLLR